MAQDLENKVALVTGAGAGIGARFADELAAMGCHVAIADLDADAARGVSRRIRAAGGAATDYYVDVGDHRTIQACVESVDSDLGGIDILINNAALHLMAWSVPVTELEPEAWERIINVNVNGVAHCARSVAPIMRRRGGGTILNMSSVSGVVGTTAYGVTKVAVRALTVALAAELGDGNIRVNCLAPGPMDTESAKKDLPQELLRDFVDNRQVLHRSGSMEDLIGALRFFCTDASSFVTGETLIVSGGYPLRI